VDHISQRKTAVIKFAISQESFGFFSNFIIESEVNIRRRPVNQNRLINAPTTVSRFSPALASDKLTSVVRWMINQWDAEFDSLLVRPNREPREEMRLISFLRDVVMSGWAISLPSISVHSFPIASTVN
jgi:hypothetical protein